MLRRDLLALGLPAGALAFQAREEVPDFSAVSLSGRKFTKTNLKGRVVLVQLWATWCGYCRREQAIVDRLVDEFGEKGLTLLAVNVGESREKVENYLRQSPRRPHVVMDKDTALGDYFHSGGFPTYVVIDREGKIADAQQGAGGEAGLRGLLASAGLR